MKKSHWNSKIVVKMKKRATGEKKPYMKIQGYKTIPKKTS